MSFRDEPSLVVEMAGSYHIPVYRMESGDLLTDGKTEFLCLHPDGRDSFTDRNTALWLCSSLCGRRTGIRIFPSCSPEMWTRRGNKNSCLFPGLLQSCDILKTAHHGSETSTTWNSWMPQHRPAPLFPAAGIIPTDIRIKRFSSAWKPHGSWFYHKRMRCGYGAQKAEKNYGGDFLNVD